jgi:MFS transporter, OFA family, oxalate/formate antiporter
VANRWLIAAAGVLMQIALGAVYAWSVFRIPLTKAYGWSITECTYAFELAILVLGFAAFAGGLWMRRSGPRIVAMTAAVLYGAGTVLAGFAKTLPMLYLTYGIIAGAGLGLAYIVPIAVLVKWFPDRRGMITGVAVAGFGSGALITAPVAQRLLRAYGVGPTFEILGAAYLVIVLLSSLMMRNPEPGYAPPGYRPKLMDISKAALDRDFTLRQALGRWQWYALWATLFLNVTAGISIISQASPMAQEIAHVNAATAAGLVGIISMANGAGRFLWAWLSDAIGRKSVFLMMFLVQCVAFFFLAHVRSFGMLATLAFIVLLCYGGGFGTMPAFAADFFGSREVGSIYGLMLTAWGFGALFGPTIIAHVREASGHYSGAMQIMSVVMLASAALPMLLRPPKIDAEDPRPFSAQSA